MISYQGHGFYAIVVEEKILKIYYYQSWGAQEAQRFGDPFIVGSPKEFWECVAYVIQDKFL